MRTTWTRSSTRARAVAKPAPGVLEALGEADAILFAPSNPYLSIGPILAVAAIREAIVARSVRCVAVSPLVGGAAVTGPAARMLTRMAGGTTPAHVTQCHKGLIDALVIDESDAPADADVELVVTKTLMRGRDAGTSARGRRPGGCVRVAIVGGTGPFGRALAARLLASGVDVVIGSRDAERAQEAARELGAVGKTNADACADSDLVILAVNADAALDTARDLSEAIGGTAVLSVASELAFSKGGVLPSSEALSLAERIQRELDAPVVAGLHSLAAVSLGADEPPDEDAFVCGDDAEAKAAALGVADPPDVGARTRRRPARQRTSARGPHGRDRQPEQALQGPRRDPRHGPRLTGELRVIPLRGIPELEEGDDLAALLLESAARAGGLEPDDVLVVAQKAVSKVEGRVVELAGIEPSERARELAGESDPRRLEVILREAREVVRSRPPLVIAETRHGFVCASAGVDASNAKGPDTLVLLPLDPDASAERLRLAIRDLTGVEIGVVVSDSFGRAWRRGTTDVALGVAGIHALLDLTGRRDASGYELHATEIAVADELAGAAQLVMGKTDGIPAAIVRGVRLRGEGRGSDLVMPRERDLFR